jgi:hypothetical protein
MARRLAAAVAAALGCAGAQAQAWLDGWHVTGTNTLRAEHYDASGNLDFSPYRDLGGTGFDELTLQGQSRPSPYSERRFFFSGVANDSPYRSQDRGLVPERLYFRAESGESPLAWRAEAGDFFAFTTLRTLQRQLKGASVELQPPGPLKQSLVLFGGAHQHSWRHAQWSDDNTLGASWLVDAERFGRWNANVLRNARGANPLLGEARDRRQTVASLAGESSLDAGEWKLRAEGEVAHLEGDGEASDSAVFAQVGGFVPAFNWRLRAERYGRDYRPLGAVTPADRRSVEAHAGWNLPQGLTLRARLQEYRDQRESANPQDTRVAGVNLGGAYAPWALGGMLDAFVQEADNAAGTLDNRTLQVTASLSRPLGGAVVGQANLFHLDQRDRVNAQFSSRTSQLQVGAVLPLQAAGLAGSVSPGLTYRRVTGPGATRDWQPAIALALAGGPHRLSLSWGRLAQEPRDALLPEVALVNAALDYRYRFGPHELGVDAIVFDRRASPGSVTEAWRVGVWWTWAFEHRPGLVARIAASPAVLAAPVPRALAPTPMLLARIAPGVELAAVEAALAAGSLGPPSREPGALVYEARLLAEVEQRQQLVVRDDAGIVERVALVVALDPADAARGYERVRRALLETYGAPAFTLEEGAWGPGFATELAAGRFIRVAEWATPSGVLRLGIPRRLDGVARIEVHHQRGSRSPRDLAWGL